MENIWRNTLNIFWRRRSSSRSIVDSLSGTLSWWSHVSYFEPLWNEISYALQVRNANVGIPYSHSHLMTGNIRFGFPFLSFLQCSAWSHRTTKLMLSTFGNLTRRKTSNYHYLESGTDWYSDGLHKHRTSGIVSTFTCYWSGTVNIFLLLRGIRNGDNVSKKYRPKRIQQKEILIVVHFVKNIFVSKEFKEK